MNKVKDASKSRRKDFIWFVLGDILLPIMVAKCLYLPFKSHGFY